MKKLIITSISIFYTLLGLAQESSFEFQKIAFDSQLMAKNSDDFGIINFDRESFLFNIDSTTFKKRKPGVAFLLSYFLPGGGQFYNGQKSKGIALLSSSATGVILVLTSLGEAGANGLEELTVHNETTFLIGVTMILGSSLYSIIDAPIVAIKLNKQNGVAFRIKPILQPQQNLFTNRTELTIGPKLTLSF
ncbi:MAG: hypothetical protein GY816_01715 [Cytophagales bacterium]|nr:hypothetical protein [Cytophagales bacterium]